MKRCSNPGKIKQFGMPRQCSETTSHPSGRCRRHRAGSHFGVEWCLTSRCENKLPCLEHKENA